MCSSSPFEKCFFFSSNNWSDDLGLLFFPFHPSSLSLSVSNSWFRKSSAPVWSVQGHCCCDWIFKISEMSGFSLNALNHCTAAGAGNLLLWVFSSEVKWSLRLYDSLLSESGLAAGTLTWFFFTGGPGVHDPCEREPTDVLSDLSAQQADAITHSAQVCSVSFTADTDEFKKKTSWHYTLILYHPNKAAANY